jgi:CubicO group peptidase (beta-lactamase class C family)
MSVPKVASLETAIDGTLDAALKEQRIVGAVLLVAHCGTVVYRRAAGLSDREAGRALRTDDLFRYSSLTKPIVTAAALSLIAHEKLALSDVASKWLPDFRPRLADGRAPEITIHQLLTHTSGLDYAFHEPTDGPYHRASVSDGMDQPGLSMEENLRRIASAPLVCAPGTAFCYSVSLDVLGAILQRVCDRPLPDIVEELVLKPLGIRDTGFTVVDAARLAVPYVDGAPPERMRDSHLVPFPPGEGISFAPARAFDERSFPSGGAGMVGTAPDMLVFLECVRKGGAPILTPESTASLFKNQVGAFDLGLPGWGFGYGGAVLLDPSLTQTPQSPGTWMWGGVYGHCWFVDPARDLTVVLVTNTSLEGMIGRLTIDVRDAVYGNL